MNQPSPSNGGPNVVIFCGGRGSGELANQLLDTGAFVICCVNAYDDGLSTGRLRHMFDDLGPSDIRKNLLSLMNLDAAGYWSRYEVFSYRYPADEGNAERFRNEIRSVCLGISDVASATSEFTRMLERTSVDFREKIAHYLRTFFSGLEQAERQKGSVFSFSDAALGNCILMGALLDNSRNWEAAIRSLEKLLVTRGRIDLVSEDDLHLCAVCSDGRVLPTEAAVISESDGDIVELFLTKEPVDKLAVEEVIRKESLEKGLETLRSELQAPVSATAASRNAIEQADVLIYGSGTFHSSILPTLMIEDVRAAIKSNSNPKTMILNIVEEADTRGFVGSELVSKIAALVGNDAIDNIAVNSPLSEKGDGYFTLTDQELASAGINARIIRGDFESRTRPGRHEPMLLVNALGGIAEGRTDLVYAPAASCPLVSIVMLAWNRKDDVEIGLREMKKITYPNVEFVVVDNGSVDGTTQMLYDQFPEVNVVRLHKNTGMTGYNVGLATARGKYVIMLDDDSHLASDAVAKMVKAWESDENADVGAMAFRVLNPNSGTLVTHLWEERLGSVEPGREREITSFAACGAAVRRDILDQVGYFDDDFFLYATEDDLAIRIWNAGYKVVYEPRCISYHRESRTMRNWKRYGSGFRNATWFNIKHLPVYMLPLMFVRNIFWLVTRSIRFKSFQYFYYGLTGLLKGYFQFSIPLKKRKRVDPKIAKFCINDNWISRPIFSTAWRIYKNKRYILDKRGVNP